MLEIGYLQPHTQARRLAKLRRIFSRAQLTSAEVALLRGVVADALGDGTLGRGTPSDLASSIYAGFAGPLARWVVFGTRRLVMEASPVGFLAS
ncbi:hypothetical protein [Candidatus Cyanaurora vandensis]|uniref:hypothetical protein n=1 Tax=Candidatus Cyanaurora vandensis TaxID=2714958 RepID=UPI00257B906D|nr:hypothetical protein [Candidatus Cyanaurora vandensis]